LDSDESLLLFLQETVIANIPTKKTIL